MPRETSAFASGRVAGANRNRGLVKGLAEFLRHLRDADQRGLEVAFNVHRQGFDRGNVKDAAPLIRRGFRSEHQAINAGQKRRQSFSCTRRGENQGGIAARDGGPPQQLGFGRGRENGLKPGTDRGMKEGETFFRRSFFLFFDPSHRLLDAGDVSRARQFSGGEAARRS